MCMHIYIYIGTDILKDFHRYRVDAERELENRQDPWKFRRQGRETGKITLQLLLKVA